MPNMLSELIIFYYALGTALVLALLAIAYALGKIAHALKRLAAEIQKTEIQNLAERRRHD